MEEEVEGAAQGRESGAATEGDFSWLGRLDLNLLAPEAEPIFDDVLPTLPALDLGGPAGAEEELGGGGGGTGGQGDSPMLRLGSGLLFLGLEDRPAAPVAAGPGPAAATSEVGRPGGPLPAAEAAAAGASLEGLDADPIAYLEAAIEADRPRAEPPNAELQSVLDALAAEAGQPGPTQLLPSAAAGAAAEAGPATNSSPQHGEHALAGQPPPMPPQQQQPGDPMAVDAGPPAPTAAGSDGRRSPDAVLRGPGSSRGTSPGEPAAAAAAAPALLAGPGGRAQGGEVEGEDRPLWTLLEDDEEGLDEAAEREQAGLELAPLGLLGEAAGEWGEGLELAGPDSPLASLASELSQLAESQPSPDHSSTTTAAMAPSPAESPAAHPAPLSPPQPSAPESEPSSPPATELPASAGAGSGGGKARRPSGGSSDEVGKEFGETDAERRRRGAFVLLQPVCSVLLHQRNDPGELAHLLAGLEVLVGEMDPLGLQGCLDYVLLPLLLAVDSIAAARQQEAQQAGAVRAGPGAPAALGAAALPIPAMSSDRTAEAALACLRAVLARAGGARRGEQLLGMLQRLAAAASLPPGRASEEVRLGALRCVSAALGPAQPAPAVRLARAVLRDEESAPLVGHLASILLQSADAELSAGAAGSKAVRAAALGTLRRLIGAVACAEALAFFVPGIVTGLARALAAAGAAGGPRVASGAAASAAAAEEALGALAEILTTTLGDDAVRTAWRERSSHSTASDSSSLAGTGAAAPGAPALSSWGKGSAGPSSAAGKLDAGAALEQLRQLALQAPGGAAGSAAAAGGGSSGGSSEAAHSSQPSPPFATAPAKQPEGGSSAPGLRVHIDWGWVEATAARVHDQLRVALPPLCSHPSPAVRQRLAEACTSLLARCHLALVPSTAELLLELLFSLAQDEWPQVAEEARRCLQRAKAGTPVTAAATAALPAVQLPGGLLGRCLLRLAEDLPGALRSGDQQGVAHARKLTTCIQVCEPAWFANHVLSQPSRLSALFSALAQAFEFDRESAALLIHAPPEAGSAYQSGKPLPHPAPSLPGQQQQLLAVPAESSEGARPSASDGPAAGTVGAGEPVLHPPPPGGGSRAAAAAAAAARGGGVVAVLLPRMHLGLALIHTTKAYRAVAAACRAAGAAAAAAAAAAATTGGEGAAAVAGSTALLRLLDHGIRQVQQIAGEEGGRGEEGGSQGTLAGGAAGAQPEQPWQLRAASLVAVLAEMVLGASPAWHPEGGPGASPQRSSEPGGGAGGEAVQGGASAEPGTPGANAGASTPAAPAPAASRELRCSVLGLAETLVGGPMWGLQTWQQQPTDSQPAPAPQQAELSAQQLGMNVLATRVAVEAVGACARALGPDFARTGRLLRATLLPLLERLGDPAPLVASAAGAAVGSICLHCGYGTLSELVGRNADYVVDGVCAQLRQLERHPRAPQLLAVLMQKAGVAPQLLPLLAEPARSAVQGVSIQARRRQPGHVLPFLVALGEIMQGAGACAAEALRDTSALAADVQARWGERLRAREQRAAAAEAAAEAEAGGGVSAREYFLRWQREKEEGAWLPGGADEEEAEEEGGGGSRVPLSDDQRALMLLRKRRVHAAASLAQTAVDCCGPLALSSSLQVAVQALGVCVAGLRCLRAATLTLELLEYKVEPYVLKQRGEVAPPDPLTPKLLPSVHLLWSPLMGALKDWRVALVEAALGTLRQLGSLAGSFLARRFGQEAWPLLLRLLRKGPAGRHIIAPGQDDLTSPATVQRVRCAVLGCLHDLASDAGDGTAVAGSSGGGAELVAPQAGPLLAAVAEWLGEKQAAVVREQATQAFMTLARLDSDAAWALLTTALQARPASAPPAAHRPATPRCPDPGLFPPFQKLCPPPPAGCPAGLLECSAGRLAAMLAQVEKMGATWHKGAITGAPHQGGSPELAGT